MSQTQARADDVVDHPSIQDGSSGFSDRLAAFLIGWPATLLLSLWCLGLIALWAPGYLTWPWFSDHDHFAMVAQAWSRGKLPYRDVFTNQFPGEIYLFRALGELAGWGNSVAFYAVDLSMVLLFGSLSMLWSLRKFGRILPGLIGFDVFLTYYLSQNYRIAGQRDWHGTFFATAGFFAIDLAPGRLGRILSGLAIGAAMSIRPQFVLVVPGIFLSIGVARRGEGDRRMGTVVAWAEWGIAAALMVFAAFLPLIWRGLLPDFIRSVRSIAYGAGFTPSVALRVRRFESNMRDHPEFLFTILALLALTRRGLGAGWWGTWSVLVSLLGMVCFSVLSPVNHEYYQIPVFGFFSVACAYLAGLLIDSKVPPRQMLAFSIVFVGLTAGLNPMHDMLKRAVAELGRLPEAARATISEDVSYGPRHAADYLRRGQMPDLQPPGRREVTDRYPWDDYLATIGHLRRSTTPETPVASLLLECVTAIGGAIPRVSPLPCESIGLCSFPNLLPGDMEALRSTPGCVVVWDPGLAEGKWKELAPLFEVVRQGYHPEARFGNIEVWRRNDDPPK